MNMFARFDENPAMTLKDIKETKCYGRMDARTDGRENSIPTTNKVCGGYNEVAVDEWILLQNRNFFLICSILVWKCSAYSS